MKSLVFVSSLLVAAGSACALPFQALSFEAGGGLPGIVGAGFTVSSGGFFVAGGAGDNVTTGADSNSFTTANEQEFDSHFALTGFGPSARNRSGATAGDNSAMTLSFYGDYGAAGTTASGANFNELESTAQNGFGPFIQPLASIIQGPGSHIGDPNGSAADPPTGTPENSARAGFAVSPPPVGSHFAPTSTGGRSAFNGIFVGRFTVQAGATLSGGMFFNTRVADGVSFGADLVLGGPAVLFNTHNGAQALGLRGYKVGSTFIDNPSSATTGGIDEELEFGQADVWDLWVQVIPTPGTLALAGLTGLAAICRRRA